jgi:hypothetical protein
MYWSNTANGTIRTANLDGSGTASTLIAAESAPSGAPAVLKAPLGTEPPAVSGGAARAALSCTRGEWAADLVGAYLYQAPRDISFQWLQNGQQIAGATSADFATTEPGSYSCRVTASNHAGETSQTSSAYGIGTVSLRARKQRVKLGQRLRLSGQIALPGDADCLAGQTVELQRKRPGDAGFDTFATVETDNAGKFTYKRVIKQPPRRFRAITVASPSCAAAKSKRRNVHKRPAH